MHRVAHCDCGSQKSCGKKPLHSSFELSKLLFGKSTDDRIERVSIAFVGKLRSLVTVAEIATSRFHENVMLHRKLLISSRYTRSLYALYD